MIILVQQVRFLSRRSRNLLRRLKTEVMPSPLRMKLWRHKKLFKRPKSRNKFHLSFRKKSISQVVIRLRKVRATKTHLKRLSNLRARRIKTMRIINLLFQIMMAPPYLNKTKRLHLTVMPKKTKILKGASFNHRIKALSQPRLSRRKSFKIPLLKINFKAKRKRLRRTLGKALARTLSRDRNNQLKVKVFIAFFNSLLDSA